MFTIVTTYNCIKINAPYSCHSMEIVPSLIVTMKFIKVMLPKIVASKCMLPTTPKFN